MGRFLDLGEETATAWYPWWFPLLIAAKECNCKPWELMEQPVFWRDVALKKIAAENRAQKARAMREG